MYVREEEKKREGGKEVIFWEAAKEKEIRGRKAIEDLQGNRVWGLTCHIKNLCFSLPIRKRKYFPILSILLWLLKLVC